MSARAEKLALFRDLLRAVARFPSKKRAALRVDIIAEFRAGAALADAAAVAAALDVARGGLATMRKYTRLDKGAREWSVSLDAAPLGGGGGGVGERAAQGTFDAEGSAQVKRL
jgi:hypothetical protein